VGDAFTFADRLSSGFYQPLSSVWYAIGFPACHNIVPRVVRFNFDEEINALIVMSIIEEVEFHRTGLSNSTQHLPLNKRQSAPTKGEPRRVNGPAKRKSAAGKLPERYVQAALKGAI